MDQAKLFLSSFGGKEPNPSDPGDPIGYSLRFRGESRLVGPDPRPSGNFTVSFWVKWGNQETNQSMTLLSFTANQCYQWRLPNAGSQPGEFVSRQSGSIPRLSSGALRDFSAWYHIVLQNDSGTTTMYLNGVRQQSANTPTGGMNMTIGSNFDNQQDDRLCGFLSAYYFIDGQILEPTVFGRYNEFGVWVPETPEGLTFGDTGFHLDFSDPTNIGADRSPNGNNFNPIGFDFTYPGLFSQYQQGSGPGSYVADPAARTYQLTSPEQTFDGNLYSQCQVGNTADPNTFGGWYYWQANLTNVTSLYFGVNSSAVATEVRINGESVSFTTGNSGPTNVFGDQWVHPEIPEDGIVNEIAFISAGAATNTQIVGFLLNGNTVDNLLKDNTSGTYDSMVDSPTQNYATGNPLITPFSTTTPVALTDANLGKIQNVSPAGNGLGPTIHWDEDAHIFFEVRVNGNPFPFNTFFAFITDPGPNVEYTTLGNSNSGFMNWSGSAAFGTNGSLANGGTLNSVSFTEDVTMPPNSVWGWEWDGPNQTIRFYSNGELLATTTQWTAGDFKTVAFYFDFNAQPASPFTVNYGQQPFIYKPEGAQGIFTESQYEPTILNGRDHFQAITGAGTGYTVYNEGTSSNPDPQQAAILTDLVGTTPTGDFMTSSVIYDMGAPVTYASPGFQATGGYWVTAGDGYQPITTLVSLDGSANSWTQVDQGTYTDQSADKFININTSTPFRYVRMRKDTQNNNLALAGPGAGGILDAAKSLFPNGLWWIKNRVSSNQHQLVDSVTNASQGGGDWASTMPTVAQVQAYTPPSGDSVAWCWDASNPAKSGFNIVQYTGQNPTVTTVPHGLPAAPDLIITQAKVGAARNTAVYHSYMGGGMWVELNGTGAAAGDATIWNNQDPDDTNFYVGAANTTNFAGATFTAYCWTSIPGYSQVGGFDGNSAVDGPFIHTGFKPAFIALRAQASGDSFFLMDTTRSPYNPTDAPQWLQSGSVNAEGVLSTRPIDILSNGFKIRSNSGSVNGGKVLYFAFAENPFQSPVTAR